jgi:8-oxo-dGTP pyrophosphatase MutT (NUDIX family)
VADVASALDGYSPVEIVRGPPVERPAKPGRRSAVMIPLYDGPDGVTTILTRRPQHMRKHAGEIAFPGGGIDDEDASDWHAAVREAFEEVAMPADVPRKLGKLDSFVTGASFSLVTPFVAALDTLPELVPSPDEVDRILHVPLEELMSPGVYRGELWSFEGQEREIHFFDLVDETIWGATALMVHRLLEIVTEHRSGPK